MSTTLIAHKEKELKKLGVELKTVREKMESDFAEKGASDTADVEKFDKIYADGQLLKGEIERLREGEKLVKYANGEEEEPKQQQFVPAQKQGFQSWGVTLVNSESFKSAQKSGFRSPKDIEAIEVKALSESVAGSGGSTVFSQRQTEIRDQARLAPTTLLDIMNIAQTTSSSIDFVAVTGFTNSAAEVKEWDTALDPDNFGLKPESDLTFELKNEPVQTIAHWIAASRNILDDVPRLRNLVDMKMVQGLRRRLEGQVIAGNGTAPNLRGIRNTSGIQTRSGAAGSASARYAATDTALDTIRRAITDISLAFGVADAAVMNPADAETMELTKDDNGNYMNVYDPVAQRVWRVRVVENMALTANRAMVGAFNGGATLYIRQDAVIRFFEQHADFAIRNALVILAELRAALEVTEPEWFVDINTLT
jgi:HK97 family phage major capsid protein